ncbi:MAG: phosphate ABC transporter substrate-binding/OmpA family protein, partial [Planctomycetota bacterium]
VSIIDETYGADAMVAYKSQFPNIDSLNQPGTRLVLTPDSPSETLARVLMSNFQLNSLSDDAFLAANDADDVFQRYRKSRPGDKQVYVLWEPQVSRILENDAMHVLIDSSRFSGFIVDCLVANRQLLVKRPKVADAVVQSYFETLYEFRQESAMQRLVRKDAESSAPLDDAAAQRLVEKIRWKNTQENYAHFGLAGDGTGVKHIADMIGNITEVLRETGGIDADPTGGAPNKLYYDTLIRGLKDRGFFPGSEEIRQAQQLQPLSDRQWEGLQPVGTLSVPTLVFARGSDRLTGRSQQILDSLAGQLEQWPQYYVVIRGNAATRGDAEANKTLAQQRAAAAEKYLLQHGVSKVRIRAIGGEPSGTTNVSFVLGQRPY